MTEEEQQAAAEVIAERDRQVCEALMSTPQGRHLMERFLDFCCEGRELYLDDGDALGMAKRDGLAKAGRWWRMMLEEHCPDLFLRMIRERRGRFARAQAALKKKEAEAEAESSGLTESGTPIEARADDQKREADKEAERKAEAERRRPKKPEK